MTAKNKAPNSRSKKKHVFMLHAWTRNNNDYSFYYCYLLVLLLPPPPMHPLGYDVRFRSRLMPIHYKYLLLDAKILPTIPTSSRQSRTKAPRKPGIAGQHSLATKIIIQIQQIMLHKWCRKLEEKLECGAILMIITVLQTMG
jgi:hypothetical protein